MKTVDNKYTYSATDLCDHLECLHLTSLKVLDLTEKLPKDAPDDQSKIIMARGIAHELRYLEQLRNSGRTIANLKDLPKDDDLRAKATIDAIHSGVDVIYQAYLHDEPFAGYADFLIKTNTPSNVGPYSYEVVDTKLALHAKPLYIIQLSLYTEILGKVQGLIPKQMHVVLGDNRRESYSPKDFYHYFCQLKSDFLKHIANQPEVYPEPCDHCDQCSFRTLCQTRREKDDHLSQVANIRSSQIRKLATAGVVTLAQLAETKETHIKGVSDGSLSRLKRQAQLQLHKRTTGDDKFILLEPHSDNLGLHTLPEPSKGDLFFDIEGNPLYPEGLEYLFGVFSIEKGKPVFKDIWAHNHPEEKRAFKELITFFINRLDQYPDMHIYHYASYEETAVKRLMSKYGVMEFEVDRLLRGKVFVDLYKVVTHSLQTSEPSYSIKNIETFYMTKRQSEVKTASASIVYYERYIESREQKWLDDIKSYNLEDCKSLHLLRDWLLKLRLNVVRPVVSEPEPDEPSESRLQQERQIREFEQALMANLPDDESLFTPEQQLDKLIFDLADFFRREAKPAWWRMFSRQTMTTEEIIDDGDCIGGLELSAEYPPYPWKRSMVYTYKFPEQDFKLQVGEQCKIAENLAPAGTIFDIDPDKRLVKLKRVDGGKEPLPSRFDLVPGNPISTDPLRIALWQFVQDYIDAKTSGTRPYPALLHLLQRRVPNIAGIVPGSPLYDSASLNPEVCTSLAKRMSDTYLFIQGPPGTGKTYTASRMIVELMKSGKKIGVTANSHKAIHNLLEKIEKYALDIGFNFSGYKKSSRNEEDTAFRGHFIESLSANEEVIEHLPGCSLIAGTCWLFANPGLSQQLDYLFVDEAGQLSLAHIISAGVSAHNLVLIGDQMQLAQPTQGVHPGESGKSVLDYLLQGNHTIPVEAGVLLDTTYRMHPKVCNFISDAIYDGRIKSHPQLEQHRIQTTSNQESTLPDAGILCDFVVHFGNGQRSVEEAARIRDHYNQLLQLEFRDGDGTIKRLTEDNILVVSPYNMQVNLLKQQLGPFARVGTVDKFQGQEAEVVLISMSTSSPEEIPRGLSFLYSQNRLNVSLSRAKTLAVLALSPELLSVRCSTIDQMRLVNTLCWVKSYSESLHGKV